MTEHDTEIEIYNKYINKTEEELETIIEQINKFETDYYDKESEYRNLYDKSDDIEVKIAELEDELKKREVPNKKKKILYDEIDDRRKQKDIFLKEMEKIYKDLGDNNIKRQKLLQIRHVIENYILQGIAPQKAFTTDPIKHEVSKTVDVPIYKSQIVHKKRTAEETGQDELNQYSVDIYKMYENNQTDDEMYKAMQAYTTIGIEKIHSTNKRYMREYEQYLDEKARMDMRVGRKPTNYHRVVGKVQKYRKEYSFIKRTQPIIEKILKERQQIEMGTDPIKDLEKGTIDIEKLKDLIKTHPSFKDIIGKTELSEMVRTGTADKTSLDNMKEFLNKKI